MTSDDGQVDRTQRHEPDHHLEHETAEDARAERLLLDRAVGGWRGIVDSGLPALLFVTIYAFTAPSMVVPIIVALGVGLVLVLWRGIRRESLRQALVGFAGLAISAVIAWRTGRPENIFLSSLVKNSAYGVVFLASILVRWPLIGVVVGTIRGEGTAWRHDVRERRVYAAASWVWVGVFFGRLAVQVPLYLMGAATTLGVVNIFLGWPLFLAGAYLNYRLLQPMWERRRARDAVTGGPEGAATPAPDQEP